VWLDELWGDGIGHVGVKNGHQLQELVKVITVVSMKRVNWGSDTATDTTRWGCQ
jgi:hypothetical protein